MSLLRRLWESPTLTTWGSFGARSLGLVAVLPLALKRFSAAEIALWQVFSTLIGLQLLAEAGFGTTFSRLVSYAMGGATHLELTQQTTAAHAPPNWPLLERLAETMRAVYQRMGWILAVVLLVAGTASLVRRVEALPIAQADLIQHAKAAYDAKALDRARQLESQAGKILPTWQAWLAWGVVLGTTIISFRANAYSALLLGMHKIAQLRRWETAFALLGVASSLSVLLLGGNLLALIVANQLWTLASAWRNRWLLHQVLHASLPTFPQPRLHGDVMTSVWPRAWRAALGTCMSYGLVQATGLLYAQTPDSSEAASYLLAMRLIQLIAQASQAPFYSKLPALATCWARAELDKLLRMAVRGMALSHWAFCIPWIAIGMFGPNLFALIGSHTHFPSQHLWILLGFATLLERYGAMHLQLFTVTNEMVWHIANGMSGLISIGVAILCLPALGVLALPAALCAGYLLFYAPYSAIHSHTRLRLPYPWFDLKTAGTPCALTLVYALWSLIGRHHSH